MKQKLKEGGVSVSEGKGMGRCSVSLLLHFLHTRWLGDGIVALSHRKQSKKEGKK